MRHINKMFIKSILNKYFLSVFIFGTILLIIHSYYEIKEYKQYIEFILNELKNENNGFNPMFPVYTIYNYWVGSAKDNIFSEIFFSSFPILVTIASSCSYYCKNNKGNDFNNPKHKYFVYRYLSAFVSSGVAFSLPIAINFISISLYLPLGTPDSVYDIYYGIFSNELFSNTFYSKPILCVLIYVIINFLYSGLIGVVGCTSSIIFKSKLFPIVSFPVFFFFINYNNNKIVSFFTNDDIIISPIKILSSMGNTFLNIKILFLEFSILSILAIMNFCIIAKKNSLERKYDEYD